MLISDNDLSKLLLENNLVSAQNLELAKKRSVEEKLPLYEIVVNSDLISDEELGKLLSDFLKIPLVRLSSGTIPQEILSIVPELVARRQKVIPFAKDKDGLKIAMANPSNTELKTLIEKKSGDKVSVFLATPKDIEEALAQYKTNLQKSFDDLLAQQVQEAGKEAKDVPIIKIVDLLIEYAYQNKASDIHIEPKEEYSLVRFRIDGVLHDVLKLPKNLHDQVITRIKVLSKLRTDEHLSAQDGKMQAELEQEDLDIRVSVVPIVDGEKAVLRLLSSRSRQFSLIDLGMTSEDLEKVKKSFSKPYGMLFSTGPTGSGKTTTIYAILKILNTREKNIATIEDPVEYDIEGISQIQVNPKTNLTFADGLRSILRQDPDIIFVGEVRDDETAEIAVNSAMTGHLVLSTIHTNDAATTLPRLIDMNIEPFLISSTINVIIGQRLVRKICEKCKISYIVNSSELKNHLPQVLINKFFSNKPEVRLYKGKGCDVCHHTGYIGRIGIFEVLEISEEIRHLITDKADSDTIKAKAQEEGMTTMMEDGIRKVQSGITTLEEVIRATTE